MNLCESHIHDIVSYAVEFKILGLVEKQSLFLDQAHIHVGAIDSNEKGIMTANNLN